MKKPENGAPLGFPLISSKSKWCHTRHKGSEHSNTNTAWLSVLWYILAKVFFYHEIELKEAEILGRGSCVKLSVMGYCVLPRSTR